MRHIRIAACTAAFVSLLLLPTTSVMAGSSSPHLPALNQAGFVKLGPLDPLHHMQIAGRRIQRAEAARRHRHWLHVQRRIAARKAAREARAAREAATSSSIQPTATGTAPSGQLAAIAACESGGDPEAVSSDGTYRGKYQFTRATWTSVGGTGDPAAAPEAEQDARAAQLLATAGPGQWPVCGQ